LLPRFFSDSRFLLQLKFSCVIGAHATSVDAGFYYQILPLAVCLHDL
jgi:hypothetical protein